MPPDLNSVPSSPKTTTRAFSSASAPRNMSPSLSRRTSSNMGPPPVPQNSSVPTSPQPSQATPFDNSGVGIGPGPIRHPRPLTAAELHLELEKEQEGIVNRLTRELTQLRAQTASVASTASTSSELFTTDSYPYTPFATSSNIIPTAARRHRSSSNLSARSARSIRDAVQNATSVSGVAAPRDQSLSMQNSSRPSMEVIRPEISRQNSMNAANQRVTSVPASPYVSHPHRHTGSTSTGSTAPPLDSTGAMASSHPRSPSITAAVAAARFEEAAFHRAELEAVKRENEMLRQKIRDLEAKVSTGSARVGDGASDSVES